MDDFHKFPSIEGFANVFRNMNRRLTPPTVDYIVKVKLHGTNAAIRVTSDGTVVAQSRSRDISLSDDNAGFARWLHENSNLFTEAVTIFGEWAGPGIQRGDAVTSIPEKTFFPFAVMNDGVMFTDPAVIRAAVPEHPQICVIPLHAEITVPFGNHAACERFAKIISFEVEGIGELDPLIQEIYGIEGPGEGLVFAPLYPTPRDDYSDLVFKVKCETHRVRKAKSAVTVTVMTPEDVVAFVEQFVTSQRCEQMLSEHLDGVAEKKRTPDFMKALGGDVKKESVADLEEMKLEWKQVAGAVNKAAARWFINRCDQIAA